MNWQTLQKYALNAFKWLLGSFDVVSKGSASARKLTAFAVMICVWDAHHRYASPDNLADVLFWDYTAIFVLLGLVTLQEALNARNGKANDSGQDPRQD